ncbi:MAG TPA: DUF6151 family protein [Polyangiaceae bacterium]|nr:DUF6151 family protein [Polyangiaceae bacterium]
MPRDIPLRCDCGTLTGVALGAGPSTGCRVVCYCDDCQAFARFLARPDTTDEWGGTDIFQIASEPQLHCWRTDVRRPSIGSTSATVAGRSRWPQAANTAGDQWVPTLKQSQRFSELYPQAIQPQPFSGLHRAAFAQSLSIMQLSSGV